MRPTCPLDDVHPRRRPPCVRLDCLTDAADAADASLISTMLDDDDMMICSVSLSLTGIY